MSSTPPAGVPFGRYLLLHKLAVGGMAEVWIARAADGSGKPVVLKRILPQFASDPEFVGRFREEAALTLSLVHGNIVPVFEIGTVGDDAYIAMEHLHGHDLRSVLRRARERAIRPPPGVAAWIVAEVLRGLDYAHRKADAAGHSIGLVHRDVSPSNVVVTNEGAVKLLDFGIAKAMGHEATRTGVLRGKVGYMSPEQARGESIGPGSDLFSTGVVLYELLTAEKLFDGESEPAILERVKSQPIPRVRDKVPAVPPELDAIVARALDRDASQRFATAAEFHAALARVLYAGAFVGDSAMTAVFLRDLFPEDAVDAESSEGDPRTATHAAGGGIVQLGPGPALILGGGSVPQPPGSSPAAARTPLWVGVAAGLALAAPLAWIAVHAFAPPPAEVAAARPGTASTTGTVVVDSTVRGSAILVDGVDTAQTTPAILTIPFGDRSITVRHADYKDRVVTVAVGATPRQEMLVQAPAERSLAIETMPAGALASIAGRGACTTPCSIGGLLPTETVLVSAARSGFRTATARVKVGDLRGAVAIHLEPLAGATAAAVATAVAVETPPPAKGHASFAARPWAFLSIDGAARTEKPLMGIALDAGRHTLRIVNEALKVDLQCPFEVQPGRDRPLATLKLEDGQATCPNLESGPSR